MNFDFSALLVFLTFVSGLIWLGYALIAKQKNSTECADEEVVETAKLPMIVEYSKSFFPIFLIVLLLRSFVFEPFKIPSASMMPTLLIGDFILVNKYEYGLRLPVLHTKFLENSLPDRGDIVVFRYPEDPSIPYIKRVIGIPGDQVAYSDKTLFINGAEVKQEKLGRYVASGAGLGMDGVSLRKEVLPGGLMHEILIDPRRFSLKLETIVPDGHYFVLGDNRDNSKDSRYWGFVPEENLMGKAFMIWMNWDSKNSGIDFSRIGTMIE